MKPEIILEEKAKKNYVYFDENQKKTIIEAMEFYRTFYPKQIALADVYNDISGFIKDYVLDFYGIEKTDEKIITSYQAEYVWARRVIYSLEKKYTKKSLEQIGKPYNQPHSTVLIGLRDFNKIIQTDKLRQDELNHLNTIVFTKFEQLKNGTNEKTT